MIRHLPAVGVLALYLLTAAVALAQDAPAALPVAALPPEATTAIPWVTGAISVISTVMLLIRELRSTIDKVHACQPTVRVLHVYEGCPKCGAKPLDGDEDRDPRTGEEPRAARAATSP